MIEKIDKILNTYQKKGSNLRTLIKIRSSLIDILTNSKDKSIEELLKPILIEIENAAKDFLKSQNLNGEELLYGMSSSIYLPSKNDWSIAIYGGKTNYDKKHDVEYDTLFDISTMTKFYTQILKDKLIEYKNLSVHEKVSDIIHYVDLKDFTLEDLSTLRGELKALENIEETKDISDILYSLYGTHIHSKDICGKDDSNLRAIIMGLAITERCNEIHRKTDRYFEILNKFIFEPSGLNNTCSNPTKKIVAGNGNENGITHDVNTVTLGGITGAYGLFTNIVDQNKFAKAIFDGLDNYDYSKNPISKYNIEKYSDMNSKKNYWGIKKKSPYYNINTCPKDYSNNTFGSNGFTGCSVMFDPNNKIHNSIMTSTIRVENELKKPVGFNEAKQTYQEVLTRNSLIIKAIKEIISDNEKIDIKIKVK